MIQDQGMNFKRRYKTGTSRYTNENERPLKISWPSKNFSETTVSSKIGIFQYYKGHDRDEKGEKLQSSMGKAKPLAVAHDVENEVEVDSITDNSFLVITARLLPKVISCWFHHKCTCMAY